MDVFGVKSFQHTTDGLRVRAEIKTDGEPIVLEMSTNEMRSLAQQFFGIWWEAAQSAKGSRPTIIPEPDTAEVLTLKGNKRLGVRFEMSNHLEFLFALTPEQARGFATTILGTLDAADTK